MESTKTVMAFHQDDLLASVDIKNMYLYVPILRFAVGPPKLLLAIQPILCTLLFFHNIPIVGPLEDLLLRQQSAQVLTM